MKTRTVKVTRQVTLVKSVVMEIPEHVTNYQLESCLYDRCNTYDALEAETSIYDMTEDDEQIDVADTVESITESFSVADSDWLDSLKHDDLLNEEENDD